MAAIMTSHICYPALEPDPARPATVSRAIVTDLLRGELGFDGIVITDAMAMKAIADHSDPSAAAVEAITSGADIVIAADARPTFEALAAAVRSGVISRPVFSRQKSTWAFTKVRLWTPRDWTQSGLRSSNCWRARSLKRR